MGGLTQALINTIKPELRRFELWDAAIKGLGMRVSPTGTKTFFVRVDIAGEHARINLGEHPNMKLSDARKAATDIINKAAAGEDPREAIRVKAVPISVEDLCEKFIEVRSADYRPSTWKVYLWIMRTKLIPEWGRRRIGAIDTDDCLRLRDSLADTPRMADNVMSLVSKLMNYAEEHGHRVNSPNPVAAIPKLVSQKSLVRDRILTQGELKRLADVMDRFHASGTINPLLIDGIRLMILTGQRKDIIRNLRWKQIDLEMGFIELPSRGRKRLIPLSTTAATLLKAFPEPKTGFVFPSPRAKRKPLSTFDDAWSILKTAAALDDVRMNDLRHTFASTMLQNGVDILIVGDVMGLHSKQAIERYQKLAQMKTAMGAIKLG